MFAWIFMPNQTPIWFIFLVYGRYFSHISFVSKSRRVWEVCKWLWCALFVITSIFKPATRKTLFSFSAFCAQLQFQRSITIICENVIIQGIQRNDMILLIRLRLNSFFFHFFKETLERKRALSFQEAKDIWARKIHHFLKHRRWKEILFEWSHLRHSS